MSGASAGESAARRKLPIGEAKKQRRQPGLTMFLDDLETASRGMANASLGPAAGDGSDRRLVWATAAHEAAERGLLDVVVRILQDIEAAMNLSELDVSAEGKATPMTRLDEGAETLLEEISVADPFTQQTALMVAIEFARGSCLDRNHSVRWDKSHDKKPKSPTRSRRRSEHSKAEIQASHGAHCGCRRGENPDGSLKIALLLIEALPLDVIFNGVDAIGRNAFMYACRYGNSTLARAFVAKARKTRPGSSTRSLDKANIASVVSGLFSDGDMKRGERTHLKLMKRGDNFEHTALHLAASHAHYRAVNGMLRSLKDASEKVINSVDKFGETPLILAARMLDESMLKLLLSFGADPSIAGVNGTALEVAEVAGAEHRCLPTIVSLLGEPGAGVLENRVKRSRNVFPSHKVLAWKDTEAKFQLEFDRRLSNTTVQIRGIVDRLSDPVNVFSASDGTITEPSEDSDSGEAPENGDESFRNFLPHSSSGRGAFLEEGDGDETKSGKDGSEVNTDTPVESTRSKASLRASGALAETDVTGLPALLFRRDPGAARDDGTIDATTILEPGQEDQFMLPQDGSGGLPLFEEFRKLYYGKCDIFVTSCVNPTAAVSADETGSEMHAAVVSVKRDSVPLPDGRHAYPALVFSPWGLVRLQIPLDDIEAAASAGVGLEGDSADARQLRLLHWLQVRTIDLSILKAIGADDTRLRQKKLEQFLEDVLEYRPLTLKDGKRKAMRDKLKKMKRKRGGKYALAQASRWHAVPDGDFVDSELLSLESRLGFSRCLSVAVVYGSSAATTRKGEAAMVLEQGDTNTSLAPPLNQLLNALAEKIDLRTWGGYGHTEITTHSDAPVYRYYASWRGFHIMLHVAPLMTKDEIRRLIGNDGVLLYVLGEADAAMPAEFRSEVNRVGIVARAHERADEAGAYDWHVGAFARQEVKVFAENLIPPRLVATKGGTRPLRDIILGLAVCGTFARLRSPPFLYMQYQLWKEEVDELVAKQQG